MGERANLKEDIRKRIREHQGFIEKTNEQARRAGEQRAAREQRSAREQTEDATEPESAGLLDLATLSTAAQNLATKAQGYAKTAATTAQDYAQAAGSTLLGLKDTFVPLWG